MQVKILIDFDGYPDGRFTSFRAGAVVTVPDEWGEIIIAKGHAIKEPAADPAPAPSEKRKG